MSLERACRPLVISRAKRIARTGRGGSLFAMVGGGDLGGRGFGRAEDALLELRELDYTPSGCLLGGCCQVSTVTPISTGPVSTPSCKHQKLGTLKCKCLLLRQV
jgi:hypothetical protein